MVYITVVGDKSDGHGNKIGTLPRRLARQWTINLVIDIPFRELDLTIIRNVNYRYLYRHCGRDEKSHMIWVSLRIWNKISS